MHMYRIDPLLSGADRKTMSQVFMLSLCDKVRYFHDQFMSLSCLSKVVCNIVIMDILSLSLSRL